MRGPPRNHGNVDASHGLAQSIVGDGTERPVDPDVDRNFGRDADVDGADVTFVAVQWIVCAYERVQTCLRTLLFVATTCSHGSGELQAFSSQVRSLHGPSPRDGGMGIQEATKVGRADSRSAGEPCAHDGYQCRSF